MEPQTSAPPVVAVVVARDPGESFEKVLIALGAQDYPNQSVLVIDAGSRTDPGPRVASVLPEAYLRRVGDQGGFAGAANDALESVQGAAFLLFCHDDVAPDPDAVRCMVEEALRSNAGIVGPKLVEWDRPDHLLVVGLAVDKTGAAESVVDRGELDQEQHDPVRDVFAVTTACMLVRSDLFTALGGFDAVMGDHGGDVDLCWRAQVAGARVLVAPSARARHHEDESEMARGGTHATLAARHHLRAMLKNYSALHLLRVLPQAAVVTVVEALVAAFTRQWPEARHLPGAWWWNLRRLKELRPKRKQVQSSRAVPDSEVRRLQVRGSVRLTVYLRRQLHAEDRAQALLDAGHRLVGSVGKGPARAASGVLVLLLLAVFMGSRELWGSRLPALGRMAPLPHPGDLFRHYADGWRTTGMGSNSAAPPALAFLGLAGILSAGHMELLRTALVLGAWPVAAVGLWRLGQPLQAPLGRLVGVIAYLAVPLPYNALAAGRWEGLLAYAAAPWILSLMFRLCRQEPFADSSGELHGGPFGSAAFRLDVLKLGLLLAVVSAFVPSIGLVAVLACGGVLVGSALTGQVTGAARAMVGVLVAVGVAAILLVPWSLDLITSGNWSTIVGVARSSDRGYGLGALLRFETGPMGAPPLGWALPLVAVLPLIVGRGWRLAWAARLWALALTCVGVVWAGGRGWFPIRIQSPEILLAPAAVAIATAAALGAVAFTVDLRRYRFGWRQAGSVTAGAVLILGTLPVFGAVPDGRWHAPANEVTRALAWMRPLASQGAFRVLWLGDPAALPTDGWSLGGGVAYATSRDGPPDVTDLLPGPPSAATRAIAGAVRQAGRGDTSRLGRLLAPMAVRYIVVPVQLGSGDRVGRILPLPARLDQGLRAQLDLRLLPADPSVVVYENTAWGPGRALWVPPTDAALPSAGGTGADLSASQPVMTGGGPVRFRGTLPEPGTVLFSETPNSAWKLSVGGQGARRSKVFGVANLFRSDRSGPMVLRLNRPWLRWLSLVVDNALWAGALVAVTLLRRRRRLEEPMRR